MGLPAMGAGGMHGALSGGNLPQDWNQGIQSAPFTPYFTGPGTVPGQQSPDPNFDFNQPGAGESYWQQNQNQFGGPTQSGSFWEQTNQRYQQPPQTTNYSGQEYQGFQRPDLINDPGLDPYYQRAGERLSNDINKQFASRGMYGSSAAFDQLSEGLGGLSAEQANREADFKMRQTAEQRAWEQLGGELAGQADASSRAGSQNELSWLQGMGGLAGQADQANLAQLMGGGSLAQMAQEMMRNRGQDMFNNVMGPSLAMAGMTGDMYNDMFQSDAQLMQNALMMESGLAQAALQASLHSQSRQKDDASWAKAMMGGGGKGKGGK